MPVRTRFAPSPTGRLHLGNARIAVFNWLFVQRHGGSFVVRLEDTDVARNREGAEEAILDDLRWLGLPWDEGPDVGGPHDPYRQSERGDLYAAAAARLLDAGKAYPCYCTPEELAAEAEQVGETAVLRYGGRCRRLDAAGRRRLEAEGRPRTIRLALPEDRDTVEVQDEVRGLISFPMNDMDDFVILRPDGRPTYNFAVVVDDADMEITHVIRGVGHLSNTPKQQLLFEALEEPLPAFAHLPTVLAPGGGKLSKRSGSTSVDQLRAAGYNGDGVVNYLSLLGWSDVDEREVLTRGELAGAVSLDRVGSSDTTYDPDKLRWMSSQHIARMDLDALVQAVRPFVAGTPFRLEGEALKVAVDALRSRLGAYGEVGEHLSTYFFPPEEALAEARADVAADPGARAVVEAVRRRIGILEPDAGAPEFGRILREAGQELSVRGPALYHPLRRALTGRESGPDLTKIMAALGRDEILRRLGKASGSEAV